MRQNSEKFFNYPGMSRQNLKKTNFFLDIS